MKKARARRAPSTVEPWLPLSPDHLAQNVENARADGASLFHGELGARDTSLRFVSVLRAPAGPAEREGLVKEIVAEAFPAHVVLLLPRGRAWGSGLFEVALPDCCHERARVH